ncbi:hypothetical protein NTJ56_03690 [Burkholderia contaminans]|uniref:hypothetical protein n=1 Tax=Burkholderia contaminans TaxID=488447 RepID=UPI001CF43344|nr:hypothetical protein [Burkholderia contaminans]MCA7919259.1 hypothetical protein [Burkholderia contaminans]UUX37940.1 hypothetical protein NTJ56_03690 [Burkholderia contaminans]
MMKYDGQFKHGAIKTYRRCEIGFDALATRHFSVPAGLANIPHDLSRRNRHAMTRKKQSAPAHAATAGWQIDAARHHALLE